MKPVAPALWLPLAVCGLGCAKAGVRDEGNGPGLGETGDRGADTDNGGDTGSDSDSDTAPVTDADGDGHDAVEAGGDDCDDADPAVFPGADDACGDGVDGDCDGADEECWGTPLADVAETVYRGEEGGDRAGAPVEMADMNGDGLSDAIVNATGHEEGKAYVVWSPRTGEVDLGTADAAVYAREEEHITYPYAGDADGDGVMDLALYRINYFALRRGPVIGESATEDAEFTVDSYYSSDSFGDSVAIAELDGDGTPELVIGASDFGGFDGPRHDGGAVLLFDGDITGAYTPEPDLVDQATAVLWGVDPSHTKGSYGDSAGDAVATGDVDGDGRADLLVGAPGHSGSGGGMCGGVYFVLGPVSGEMVLGDSDATWEGDAEFSVAGAVLATGDLDGDGLADVAIGSPTAGDGSGAMGAAWVVTGFEAGVHNLADARTRVTSTADTPGLGSGVLIADLEAPHSMGFAVGADSAIVNAASDGAVFVWDTLPEGTVDATEAPLAITGRDSESAGISLAAGDADGDWISELLVGASHVGNRGEAGAAWLVSIPAIDGR